MDHQGVLRFETQNSGPQSNVNYQYLFTEYRPKEKELIFKDYVDLWGDTQELDSLQYSVTMDKANNQLKVQFLPPKFKEQLLQDYPELINIRLTYRFYMIKDPSFFQRLMACGFGAINEFQNLMRQMQVNLKRERIKMEREQYTIHFEEEHLKMFKNDPTLNLYADIEIDFIEKQEDELDITLNRKFTKVPFFYVSLKNQYLVNYHGRGVFILLLVILGLWYLNKKYRGQGEALKLDFD